MDLGGGGGGGVESLRGSIIGVADNGEGGRNRREIGGEEFFRTGNWGQHWGVLHADRNREVCARGRNAQQRAEYRTAPQSGKGLKGVGAGHTIRITSLNIRSGRVGGLEAALRALRQGKVRVVIIKETKLTNGIVGGLRWCGDNIRAGRSRGWRIFGLMW